MRFHIFHRQSFFFREVWCFSICIEMGFLKVFLLILLVEIVLSEKVFKSVPVTVKAYENDTVLLPCYTDNTEGDVRVRWYKSNILVADSRDPNLLLPLRTRMHANFSLQLDELVSSDTADYTCEGEPMALLEHRSRIRFRAEHRLLAGVYECSLNNGVGDPVTASITVIIQDAPVVSTDRSFVHTALGLRAALAAKLEFAIPAARTAWYRDGQPVKTDDRIVMMVRDNVHQLIFRTVRKADLGNYTFRAENKLGMADVAFKLTGVPNVASFKVDPVLNKATSTSFTLIWEVDSYSTIIEYNLWLRPYYGRLSTPEPDAFTTETPANLWSKIVVPGDSSDGPIHSATYTVRGLTPSTVYEAIVTSRNRFGWSKPSAVLHFATEPGVGRTLPATSEYTDITPILEEIESQEPYNITQAHVFDRLNEVSSGARETPSCAAIFVLIVTFLVGFFSD
ncbi:protein CEPU-1 isoform X3 [Maniola hyperantus]|uniref:protein CEPU-1 isoform X3 n=1 Tax=Aphantopus hyperantus TaxID=2795564 RepID=UPI00374A4BEC